MKMTLKLYFTFLLLTFTVTSFSQTYLLENEICIISFKTTNNKIVMLAKDKDNRYLIYRFGTKDKIEFEFPDKNESSWTKFKYSYYSRGGGKRNASQDLIHISFINNGYKYFLYDTYHSERDEFKIGVLVTNLTTQKNTDCKGKLKSKKGSLHFKESNLLEVDDEI